VFTFLKGHSIHLTNNGAIKRFRDKQSELNEESQLDEEPGLDEVSKFTLERIFLVEEHWYCICAVIRLEFKEFLSDFRFAFCLLSSVFLACNKCSENSCNVEFVIRLSDAHRDQ
jgi:hypothetical protein